MSENATELDTDPAGIVIIGTSAGGGLAAGTALLARDRNGPALLGQLLVYPMLDDRDATVSTRRLDGAGLWDRARNVTGWGCPAG